MLSLVIPVLNEAAGLPLLLDRLREQFPDAELIVVDGGSDDRSVAAAMPGADCVLLGPRGRAAQMNLGGRSARGDWLGFLHSDTLPQFNAREFGEALQSDRDWAFCRIHLHGRSRGLGVIAWFMNHRSRLTRVATGDQFLLVRRPVFEQLGGFGAMPLMEDVEFCKRLRRHGAPAVLGLTVASSGRRWDEQGLVKTVLQMWGLRLAYWLGVSPRRLWEFYYGARSPGLRRKSTERGGARP